jgi:hypothetical protein
MCERDHAILSFQAKAVSSVLWNPTRKNTFPTW